MAQAGLASSTICPAARLAREAALTILRFEGAEVVGDETRALEDRLDALGDAASYVRAASPLGAYFQLLLAVGEVNPDAPWVGRGGSKSARRVERLLRSAGDFLQHTNEPAAAGALAAYYATPRSLQLFG
ncbi:hypothetical protein [Phenylobacterium sp.]|uniref:hypothetical protein n=1 Tax=Phenylobacterium sp. TaxID=1871053 RepID=UPI002DEC1A58|nr:hypothetical protein [Phenylobacterium sp.]